MYNKHMQQRRGIRARFETDSVFGGVDIGNLNESQYLYWTYADS